MNRSTRIAVVTTIVFYLGIVAAQAQRDEPLPQGLVGFCGQVRGVVVAKGDRNSFTFKVARVLRVWKNNTAEAPESLVGRTVTVAPRWTQREDGTWRPVERHVAFIRGLRSGQEITLEIRNVERSHFSILELSAEQRTTAERVREGARPEAAARRDSEGRDAEIRELKREIERLRTENEELRRLNR